MGFEKLYDAFGADEASKKRYKNLEKHGKNPIRDMVGEAEQRGIDSKLLGIVKLKAMADGYWDWTPDEIKKEMNKVREITQKGYEKDKSDFFKAIEDSFDPVQDADLITNALFLDERVQQLYGHQIGALYRAQIRYGEVRREERRKEKMQSKSEENVHVDRYLKLEDRIEEAYQKETLESPLSEGLERVIDLIEEKVQENGGKETEEIRHLMKLVRKKADREVFPIFRKNPTLALAYFDKFIKQEDKPVAKKVYEELKEEYEGYIQFKAKDANDNFVDPETGEKGVLPSLHQKIALYQALEKGRYAVLDGCGTGKTAIGSLLFPLIKEKKIKEGAEVKDRMLVIGTIPCLKTWRKAFCGKEHERHLRDKYEFGRDFVVVNGDDQPKDEALKRKLDSAKVVFVNYNQLVTEFKTKQGRKKVYEVLRDLGFDLVVMDEVHNVKNKKSFAYSKNKRRMTLGGAARTMAFSTDRVLLLSGTPAPDNITDYANIYHILRPDLCKDPDKFVEQIKESKYNPRKLATFVDENMIRRNSSEVIDLIEMDEDNKYDDIRMTDVQRKIYEHIRTHQPKNLIQLRKCLLDPRLVDPEILAHPELNLLGKVTMKDSAKYQRLEELLLSEDGPLKRGDKFVVFSSMFKEGVTREAAVVRERYSKLGLKREYATLGMEETLLERLNGIVARHGKKIEIIDGDVNGNDAKSNLDKRDRITTDFHNKKENVGLLCTTEAGGESLDFSNACHVYFLDEDWSPATTDQALARLQRKGQKKRVSPHFIRLEDSVEPLISKYVDKKRLAIKVMLDGQKPSDDEIDILSSNDSRIIDLVKRQKVGTSEDYSRVNIQDSTEFGLKKRVHTKPRGNGSDSQSVVEADYIPTEAQKIREMMGRYGSKVWSMPEFVELYAKFISTLSIYPIQRAKVCSLLNMADKKEIEFPRKIVSEGAGPSILYNAYQDLGEMIKSHGYVVPKVTDRDTSKPMLLKGNNPNQVLGNMRGIGSIFKPKQFDMVDNASISLLKNADEVKETLTESNRILKEGGLLGITLQNLEFKNGFTTALERLGFESISGTNEGFVMSKQTFDRLKKQFDKHYAEAYRGALGGARFLLARKDAKPDSNVDSSNLWFMHPGPEKIEFKQPEEQASPDVPINSESDKKKQASQSAEPQTLTFTPEMEVTIKGGIPHIKRLSPKERKSRQVEEKEIILSETAGGGA